VIFDIVSIRWELVLRRFNSVIWIGAERAKVELVRDGIHSLHWVALNRIAKVLCSGRQSHEAESRPRKSGLFFLKIYVIYHVCR
jgi:hypothetical protein